jgi:tRNA-Thr(GGU) m(6)t(6)A37 methyltransferase TsaA
MPESRSIEPIGVVRSCFAEKFGVPRQPGLCPSAWGHLEFYDSYRSSEALRGLDGFSHLWLIFGFHQTVEHGWNPTVRPPRLGGNERVGVFASRSTFRPNSLGLSLVRLEEIIREGPDAPRLLLGGVDLVDGTPVYDIKPYLPYAESIPHATAGFAGGEIHRLTVEIETPAHAAFEALPERSRRVILEALSLDPRPAIHEHDAERDYGATLCGVNVRFRCANGECRITSITGL